MKKKILSAMGVMLSVCFLFGGTLHAEENGLKKVDGSYLTKQESATGEANRGDQFLRGEHLMDGSSSVSKAGIGRLYIYAQTTADHTVDRVGVWTNVDMYVEDPEDEDGGYWETIDYLDKEATDTYYVALSKFYNKVDRGTYYRVMSEHYVYVGENFEETISFTDGIWMD